MSIAKSKKGTAIQAGTFGALGGTVLLYFAELISEPAIREAAIYAVPSLSLALSALWTWFKIKTDNYLKRRKALNRLIKVRVKLEKYLENPNTSLAHKNTLKKRLEIVQDQIIKHELGDLEHVLNSE